VINAGVYLSNDQTSNSEAKGIDDEGRIKPARSKRRGPVGQSRCGPRLKLTVSQLKLSQLTPTLRKGELP
jgi:hypothetical protein